MIYYDVNDLRRDSYPVILLLPSGAEVKGFRRTITRGARSWVKWVIRTAGGQTEDLPKRIQITRWRPADLQRFPDPLPAPARVEGSVNWHSKPEPIIPAELQDAFEWHLPYALPPLISAREAEVRLIRGLRCMRSRYAVKDDYKTTSRDSVLVVALRALGEWEHEFIDHSALAAVGMPWEPTRADHGDWLTALSWFRQLNWAQRNVIELRSLNPPFSYMQIGERHNPPRSHEWARRRYRRAIERVTEIANEG